MKKRIEILKNGPYKVSADIPLTRSIIKTNEKEESIGWDKDAPYAAKTNGKEFYLCRCGRSDDKPFCDGSHELLGFSSTDTARKEKTDENLIIYEGTRFNLHDQEDLCAKAHHCMTDETIWELINRPVENSQELAKELSFCCPSGRLTLTDKDNNEILPNFEKEISAIEDPLKDCYGPLWVKGDIKVRGVDGEEIEVSNRMTLCRCGQSERMPFCDGHHYDCEHMQPIKKNF